MRFQWCLDAAYVNFTWGVFMTWMQDSLTALLLGRFSLIISSALLMLLLETQFSTFTSLSSDQNRLQTAPSQLIVSLHNYHLQRGDAAGCAFQQRPPEGQSGASPYRSALRRVWTLARRDEEPANRLPELGRHPAAHGGVAPPKPSSWLCAFLWRWKPSRGPSVPSRLGQAEKFAGGRTSRQEAFYSAGCGTARACRACLRGAKKATCASLPARTPGTNPEESAARRPRQRPSVMVGIARHQGAAETGREGRDARGSGGGKRVCREGSSLRAPRERGDRALTGFNP